MKLTGYADRASVRPGDTLRFMINCERPRYRADIVRLICGDAHPDGPGYKEKLVRTRVSREYPGRRQVIEAGSYAMVDDAPPLRELKSFSVQAWVWPTLPGRGLQMLCSRWNERSKAGFALVVAPDGSLGVQIGGGKGEVTLVTTRRPMRARQWYFVAATFDAGTRTVRLCQEAATRFPGVDDSAQVNRRIAHAMARTSGALMFAAARRGRVVGAGAVAGAGATAPPRLAIVAPRATVMPMSTHRAVAATAASSGTIHAASPRFTSALYTSRRRSASDLPSRPLTCW